MTEIPINLKYAKSSSFLEKYVTPEHILLCAYLVITGIMLVLHTTWRDEGQAWLIARDRPNLIDILTNINYEGTPGLWHTCLYILSNLLQLPIISMYILHSAFNITAVYLFVKKTNFKFITKVLFCGSYFIIYEYNIIARSYVLTLLLLFIWALLFSQRFIKRKQYAVIIGLLAQTSTFGLLISVVLGSNYIFELLWPLAKSESNNRTIKYLKDLPAPILIIITSLLLSYLQLHQSTDSSFFWRESTWQ